MRAIFFVKKIQVLTGEIELCPLSRSQIIKFLLNLHSPPFDVITNFVQVFAEGLNRVTEHLDFLVSPFTVMGASASVSVVYNGNRSIK